jgi:hypothetical protein
LLVALALVRALLGLGGARTVQNLHLLHLKEIKIMDGVLDLGVWMAQWTKFHDAFTWSFYDESSQVFVENLRMKFEFSD